MAVDIERASDIVDAGLSRQRLGMTLMLGFGLAAVALAAVGIYGVIAYGAAQRRNELAVRLALGATPREVFGLMLKQGGLLAVDRRRDRVGGGLCVGPRRLELAVRSAGLGPADPGRRDDRRRRASR